MCDCPKVNPIKMDDKAASEFFVNDWFIQKQAETPYLKKDYNNCVRARYKKQKPSWFGYTVNIDNVAKSDSGVWKESGSGFFGRLTRLGGQRNPKSNGDAKFLVAPQFLPKWFAGDYWILAHENKGDKEQEFAVVCGGQPAIPVGDGTCTFDTTKTNGSGLWIFTRDPNPKDKVQIIKHVETIITNNGISLQGLNPVNQCPDYCKK